MPLDINKPQDSELARTLPGYIRETRAAIEQAVTDSEGAVLAVTAIDARVDILEEQIAAAIAKFPDQNLIADGDSTPSVASGIVFKTLNTTATDITYFDGGFAGQMIIVFADDENTTIVHNPGYIILEGGQSITFNKNQGIILSLVENSVGNKQWIQVGSIGGSSGTGNAKFNRDVFVSDGITTAFDTSVSYQPGSKLMFPYVGGVLQPNSKFTETDANTVTLVSPAPEGETIELVYITYLSVTTSVDDLYIVNKPYVDARTYESFYACVTDPNTANKLIVVSTAMAVNVATTVSDRDVIVLTDGDLSIADGYTLTFEKSIEVYGTISGLGNLEVTGNLSVNGGGRISVDGSITLINLIAGLYQVFDGDGSVTGLTEAMPEWFNGDLTKTCFALSGGGKVVFSSGTYTSNFLGSGSAMIIDNITFVGAGKPIYASDFSHLVGGTIIEGPLFVRANGFAMSDLGVDSGLDVVTNRFSGLEKDAFVISNAGITTTPMEGFTANNITCLCKEYNATVHAFLNENTSGSKCNNIDTVYGEHGFVCKSRNASIDNIYSRDHASDGFIVKSDSYANAIDVTASNINIGYIVSGHGGGLRVQGVTASAARIHISNVNIVGTSFGIRAEGADGYYLSDSSISNFVIETCTQTGLDVTGNTTGHVNRCKFINGIINNAGALGCSAYGSDFDAEYDSIEVTNATLESFYANTTSGRGARFSKIGAIGVASGKYAFDLIGGTCAVDEFYWDGTGVDRYKTNIPTSLIPEGKIQPTLLNSWANVGGATPVSYSRVGGAIHLEGFVNSGAAVTIFNLPAGCRPQYTQSFAAMYRVGATANITDITVYASGDVTVFIIPGTYDYISLCGISFVV